MSQGICVSLPSRTQTPHPDSSTICQYAFPTILISHSKKSHTLKNVTVTVNNSLVVESFRCAKLHELTL